MDRIVFYREWFPLPKQDFRLLAMLADVGEFKGTLSDMCRYFSLSIQSSNRNKLKSSIELLTEQGYIRSRKKGNTYYLEAIPKEKEITVERGWLHRIQSHDYTTESIAWEQVVKVLLWIVDNKEEVITNQDIADDLGISISTIGYAKNVLEKEYDAISRRKVSEKIADGVYLTLGQELTASAWWNSG